ncbi:MAG: Eco57I restriction-modification methylase domain-containing protein [Anaerolineales bacterium]|nr:Eco57I restriction-modification methylase domain-containing protein [Anaerolineales bacterium]MBX3038951.1 Eco57I restriction-modification methylase domain-containing protein [Anaerolineales bacterium]
MIQNYNPDVLSCLANLSNDEVFTPPNIANQMLDLLPEEIWRDKNITFLDPACKTGIFLREIAKRLMIGLEKEIPNRQKRINHIFTKQLFALPITNITALLSRRSVYCSKNANGKYSICDEFDDPQGNIRFTRIEHDWGKGDRCTYCGASLEEYARSEELESHAYQFIHTENPEEIFNMNFDVIIGNPPYQLSDAGDSTGSSPIYQIFVEQAKKLNPRYLTMIIPSRWFAGGKNLDDFRDSMLNDEKISYLVDYPIASDIFPGVKVIGGICYFLWEKDYKGQCTVTTYINNTSDTLRRPLNQFDTFVRFNKAISILEKVKKKGYGSMMEQVSTQKPFGLRTFVRPTGKGNITLYANKVVGKIEKSEITNGLEMVKKWKVFISRGYGEGGESRDYPRMILGKPIVGAPNSACTETYIVVGVYDDEEQARNLEIYLQTKFLRFLVGLRKNTQDVTKDRFAFVPLLPMTKKWTDKKLFSHFELDEKEIAFIESMIRPMGEEADE